MTTTSSAASVPPVQTKGLSQSEIADRTAIQAMWIRYWDVVERIVRVPQAQRKALISQVAAEPVIGNLLSQAAIFDSKGWDNYGGVTHRVYWGPSVDGQRIAIIGDCLDNSKAGRLDVKSKEKLTVGVVRSNVRGSFERESDGSWRVTGIDFVNAKC